MKPFLPLRSGERMLGVEQLACHSLWHSHSSRCWELQSKKYKKGFGYRQLWMLWKTMTSMYISSTPSLPMRGLRLNSAVFQCSLTPWCYHFTVTLTAAIILFPASASEEGCLPWSETSTVEDEIIRCLCLRGAALCWSNTPNQAVTLLHLSRTTPNNACELLLVHRCIRRDRRMK